MKEVTIKFAFRETEVQTKLMNMLEDKTIYVSAQAGCSIHDLFVLVVRTSDAIDLSDKEAMCLEGSYMQLGEQLFGSNGELGSSVVRLVKEALIAVSERKPGTHLH